MLIIRHLIANITEGKEKEFLEKLEELLTEYAGEDGWVYKFNLEE